MVVARKAKSRSLAIDVVKQTRPEDRELLLRWAEGLLAVRNGPDTIYEKAKQALALTASSQALIPLIKLVAKTTKRVGWEERSLPARLAISAATLAIVTTGGGAGIAALGGAIGVPLWVVFGAGGAFVGVLIDEIAKAKSPPPRKRRRVPGLKSKTGTALTNSEEIIEGDFVEVKTKPALKTPKPRAAKKPAKARRP